MAACRALLRTGSRTFHLAGLLLPRSVREPASALYAFCRLADDAVDVAGGRAAAVARLRERLGRAYEGRPLPIPADRAFAHAVARHAIPRALPEALLEGLAWDAEGRRYASLADLLDYAARVAGAVGAMMALVMGVRDADAVARACELGMAMQLSNIARDVGEDARAGRLYLPLDWLAAAGVDADAFVASPVFTPALGLVVRRLLDHADGLYARGAAGVRCLPLACRPGIGAAGRLYAAIGHQVARQGLDSVASRAVVPASRKLLVLAGLVGRAVASDAAPATQARFLVTAVLQAPLPVRAPDPAPRRTVGEQIVWIAELFERLEQRDSLGNSGV
jgi:phytoene synthase